MSRVSGVSATDPKGPYVLVRLEGESPAVSISQPVLARLRRLADRSRPGETGGLLIGRVLRSGALVEISEHSEISLAPGEDSDEASGSRLQAVADQLAGWVDHSQSGMTVVGIYRACPAGALALTHDETALFADYPPFRVGLLLQLSGEAEGTAALYCCRYQRLIGPRTIGLNRPEAGPTPLPVVPPLPYIPYIPIAPPWYRTWRAVAALVFGVGLCAGTAGALLSLRPRLAAAPRTAVRPVASTPDALKSLGFNYVNVGTSLVFTWDRASAPIRDAERGTLVINDGPWLKQLELTRDDLLSGAVLYKPDSPELVVRVQLARGADVQSTEPLRIIPAPASSERDVPARTPYLAARNAAPAAFTGSETREKTPIHAAAPAPASTLPPATGEPAPDRPPGAPVFKMAERRAPLPVQTPLPAPDLKVNPSAVVPETISAMFSAPPAPPPRPAAPPAPRLSVQRAPMTNDTLEAAVPIKRVVPTIGFDQRQMLVNDAEVDVLVSIDATGTPVRARVVSGPPMLRETAVHTVMQWRFRPAHIGDRNLPSDMKVTFRFARRAR